MKISIKTKIPGPNSARILRKEEKLNGGWSTAYPFVHSRKGEGAYFKDLDGNTFLDFASQIASNPLGYNHQELIKVLQKYSKHTPLKYAGADFAVKETTELIEELITITPKNLNSAFLINSGAEAVENCIKIAMKMQPKAKFGISFQGAFHGRTLGALSLTNSRAVHKNNYFRFPTLRLPFNEEGAEELGRIIYQEGKPEEIAFVILEHVQGEGGYRIPNKEMVRKLREICKKEKIPYIADEVQAGMGRTGEWWAYQHFGIEPDIMSSAKALKVGAAITNKKNFPKPGAISSTWGGGHILDMAMGLETIKIIKKQKLLEKNQKNGEYMRKRLQELENTTCITETRGLGLMNAFTLPTTKTRNNLIIESLKQGLVLVGCGEKSIRLIPPYIIEQKEIDEGLEIIEKAAIKCGKKGFKHKGKICNYVNCGEINS